MNAIAAEQPAVVDTGGLAAAPSSHSPLTKHSASSFFKVSQMANRAGFALNSARLQLEGRGPGSPRPQDSAKENASGPQRPRSTSPSPQFSPDIKLAGDGAQKALPASQRAASPRQSTPRCFNRADAREEAVLSPSPSIPLSSSATPAGKASLTSPRVHRTLTYSPRQPPEPSQSTFRSSWVESARSTSSSGTTQRGRSSSSVPGPSGTTTQRGRSSSRGPVPSRSGASNFPQSLSPPAVSYLSTF